MDTAILKKRFWSAASVREFQQGYTVLLDDRPLRTPAKEAFVVPSAPLAQAVADEWAALGETIDPTRLPFTKLCNAAIDNMAQKAGLVVEALAEYAQTDLVCYRADSPVALVERQTAAWDPLLAWIREVHGVFFVQTTGILPVEQPPASVQSFHVWLRQMDSFRLMAAHDLVILSGSIVIARAVIEGKWTTQQGWEASIVDEIWQADTWGEDAEALALRAAKSVDFATAAQMISYLD